MYKIILLMILSYQTFAAETMIGELAMWAEENYQITEKLAPISTDFKLTEEQTERVTAAAEYQDEYRQIVNSDSKVSLSEQRDKSKSSSEKEDCQNDQFSDAQKDRMALKELAKKRITTIAAYARFGADQMQQELSESAVNNYTKYMRRNNHAWAADYNFIVKYYLFYRPKVAAQWDSLSKEDKMKHIKKYLKDKLAIDVPAGLILKEQTILEAINNPSKWKESFSELKDKLTYTEKYELLADLGYKFEKNFSESRALADNPKKLTIEDMFKVMKDGTEGGVCRDVVAALSEIAVALDFPKENIYRIAYYSAQDSHQTLAIVHPNDPSKLFKINYNEVQVDSENQGISKLKQAGSMPVAGISYKIYDAEGKPVLQTPTELGKMLREASGFKDKNDISKTYNINKLSATTKYGNASIVTGNLSDQTKVVAVTLSGSKYGMDYGVGVYKSDGETDKVSTSSTGFYGYMQINPKVTYHATDKISVTGDAELLNEFQVMKNNITYKQSEFETESTLTDVATTFTPGIQVDYDGEKVDGYFRVEAETALINKDAQDQAEGFSLAGFSSKTFAKNSVNYKSGISYEVAKDLEVAFDAALYTRNIGDYYLISGMLKGETYDIQAKYQAPKSKDIPAFIPGSYAVTEISGSKNWKKEDGTGPTLTFGYTTDEVSGGQVNLGGSWSFY